MKRFLKFISILLLIFGPVFFGHSQDSIFVVKPTDVSENGYYSLPKITQWEFKKGHDPSWKNSSITDKSWIRLDSAAIANSALDEEGKFEGWFRFRLKVDGDFKALPVFLESFNSAAQHVYVDGQFVGSFGDNGKNEGTFKFHGNQDYLFLPLEIGKTHQIAVHFLDRPGFSVLTYPNFRVLGQYSFLYLTDFRTSQNRKLRYERGKVPSVVGIFIMSIFLILILMITWLNNSEKHLRYVSLCVFLILLFIINIFFRFNTTNPDIKGIVQISGQLSFLGLFIALPLLCSQIFYDHIAKWVKILVSIILIIGLLSLNNLTTGMVFPVLSLVSCLYIIFKSRTTLSTPKWAIVTGIIGAIVFLIITSLFESFQLVGFYDIGYFYLFSLIFFPCSLFVYVILWLRESVTNEKKKADEVIALTKEKQVFLEDQNIQLEEKVSQRTKELNDSLENLKSTQSQLIQSEKMASLGELTAGIAHEIQNPLNFVNNFSEVSKELLEEMQEEIENGDFEEVKAIMEDVIQNLEKIHHHGKRADNIVKGMLQHSRSSSGTKEPTDINALADEYLRLAYHGLRAKDKSFNAELVTDFDDSIGTINIIPQDMGRVILNLITNGFYAVNEKKQQHENFKPMVSVSTKKIGDYLELKVTDNGNGIPKEVVDKIFQPFFTTKPTGQGTGLGLSMSYDIVTKGHGGELKVETDENEGTVFIITLPV